MLKKLYIIILFLLCSTAAKAQDFEIVSVESLPNDFSAREEMKTDHNDRQCALLRIATQNIAPNEKDGFNFVPDLGSEVAERATRDGEIWLWVSPGLKYLRIKHGVLGQFELKMLDYVSRVESLNTYKIVIRGKLIDHETTPTTTQFLAFQVTPINAVLEVNGEVWSLDATGSASRYLDFGTYSYRVRASNYFAEEGEVTVDDPENTKVVKVVLMPDIVEITFNVNADAEIWVNNQRKGIRSWSGQLGSGIYKVECRQDNHETQITTQEITASMNGQTITLPSPKPIYGSLMVESDPNFCKVFLDGEEIGETPKNIQQVLIGQHELKLVKDGYLEYSDFVTIKKGEREMVHVTMVDGGRYVQFVCNVSDAHLRIDAMNVGNASGTYNLKDGRHSIKVTANGYNDYATAINVNENNTLFHIDLQKKGRNVYFSCNAPFSVLEIDGVRVGSASGNHEIMDGEHEIRVTAVNFHDYVGHIVVNENTNSCDIQMREVTKDNATDPINKNVSSISGKISDYSNAGIALVAVVATHIPSGAQYYVMSDAQGVYRIVNIRPGGPYKVEFRKDGYKLETQRIKIVPRGDTMLLNARLNKGSSR